MPASTSWRRKSRSRIKRSRLMRPRSRIFVRSSKRRTKNRQRNLKRRNRMWGFNKKNQNDETAARPGGIDFDSAAARVTAADPLIAAAAATTVIEKDADEALIIKQEWAIVAVKGAFYPAARWIHPAYAVNDAEAAKVGPKMQVFLQAVADKYAPAVVGRLASRYPEFWDVLGAVGILYYEKWRAVSQLIAEEEERVRNAKN